jgi:hypothetical protein
MLVVAVGMALVPSAMAQSTGTVEVTYPQPVNLLRGRVEVTGTITVPGATNYYIQARDLDETTLEPVGGEEALWSPATLPRSGVVTNGVLGAWNTQLISDGLYEIELVVPLPEGGDPRRVRIGPLRVANDEVYPYAGVRYSLPLEATPAPQPGFEPTSLAVLPTAPAVGTGTAVLPPTATPLATRTEDEREVSVTALIQANVRLGDSVAYPPIGYIDVGDSLEVVGVSNRSAWYQVVFEDDLGFIAPSTVRTDGDPNFLPRVAPPPLPFTPTPFASVTPVFQGNLVLENLRTEPDTPVCNEAFVIYVTVRNAGSDSTRSSGTIDVRDLLAADGFKQEDTIGGFPALGPGETFEAIIPMTVDTNYNETHRLILTADILREIPEENEDDNTAVKEYTLQPGTCDDPPTEEPEAEEEASEDDAATEEEGAADEEATDEEASDGDA